MDLSLAEAKPACGAVACPEVLHLDATQGHVSHSLTARAGASLAPGTAAGCRAGWCGALGSCCGDTGGWSGLGTSCLPGAARALQSENQTQETCARPKRLKST